MVNRKIHPKKILTAEEKECVQKAIQEVEQRTSGEIRVALEKSSRGEILERARKVFEKLGMTRTRERNGVLFFFRLRDKAFAILGDKAIHEKLGDGFWRFAVSEMEPYFRKEDFGAGLQAGIRRIGLELAKHFPRKQGDRNELPDNIAEK